MSWARRTIANWFNFRPHFRIPAADGLKPEPRRVPSPPPVQRNHEVFVRVLHTRLPATSGDNFRALASAYYKTEIEFPHLKEITFAQWAIESTWGRSSLARRAKNFGGMKWSKSDGRFGGAPEGHTTGDGYERGFRYTTFPSYLAFIRAYWARLDAVDAYHGWRNHVSTPEAFIRHIGPSWVGYHPDQYVRNVLRVYDRYMKGMFYD